MLRRVDRMLLAVRDREAAADTFRSILGAERLREDTSRLLGARRTVVQAGISEFELIGDATLRETRRFYRVLLKPLLRTHRRVQATHSCNTQLPGRAHTLQFLRSVFSSTILPI